MTAKVDAQIQPRAQTSRSEASDIVIGSPNSLDRLPPNFGAFGTIAGDKRVKECFFQSDNGRTDAWEIKKSGKGWIALFQNVPPCDNGTLIVVGENSAHDTSAAI